MGSRRAAVGAAVRPLHEDPPHRRPAGLVGLVHPGPARAPRQGHLGRAARRCGGVRAVEGGAGRRGLPRRQPGPARRHHDCVRRDTRRLRGSRLHQGRRHRRGVRRVPAGPDAARPPLMGPAAYDGAVTSTSTRGITCTVDDGLAHVWLDRPDKLNGLTLEMLAELVATSRRLAKDRTLRAVVLTGAGESFSAGLDFASTMRNRARVARSFVPSPLRGTNIFQEAAWGWRRVPVPVIAVVKGHCYGAGLQIALGADFRISTPEAQWSVLEARWGLIPDMSGVRSLAQLVGLDTAKLLTMTGATISGARAHELGLVTTLSA